MKTLTLSCFLLFNNFNNASDQVNSTTKSYLVVKIKDGDTIDILINNTSQTIRLAHIDCPEKKQPFGNIAKQFVEKQCFKKYITLQGNNKYDRNHRLIAEVILTNGINLNQLLVKNGMAWHFKKYSTSKTYADLQNISQKNKIGLWAMENPIEPAEWRKQKKRKNNTPPSTFQR